jgi:protein-S-isoprenylcysteine O-methyltransferase Ste14
MKSGYLAPLLVYLAVLLLHLVLPARHVRGYVRGSDGKPLGYRLNGLGVLFSVLVLYAALARLGFIPWDYFYRVRWEGLASACALGVLFTLAVVLGGRRTQKGLLADLYLGRRENPQWLDRRGRNRVDAKMYLYLIGAVQLELNVLSFAAHQALSHEGAVSPGVLLYAALFTFFVCEYLFFEEVHLYTYDFIAERVGFKLGWGCIAFYPYFYCVGLWAVAERPDPHTPLLLLVFYVLVFFCGWAFSRGANLQKFLFKTRPEAKLLGLFAPEVVSDGQHRLLCSGFWGLARHINYLGEILMAVGLTLVLGWPGLLWPWLYPLYYLLLLVPRQLDDDKRCERKYGALWTEYCRRVRYRILPGVY